MRPQRKRTLDSQRWKCKPDKVTTELESPKDGILQIIIDEQETVQVGTIIGEIIDAEDL